MPAAAVIPAPRAYINVAAVKTLLVEGLAWLRGRVPSFVLRARFWYRQFLPAPAICVRSGLSEAGAHTSYFEKIGVFKTGYFHTAIGHN